MVALYVTSLEKSSGKTLICAGLGKYLIGKGQKIGFFKPIITKNQEADSDATFLKQLFELEEPSNIISPVFSDEANLISGIKEVYDRISRGKNVVITEGASEQRQISHSIIDMLDARVIMVQSFNTELTKSINSYKELGKHLLGVVLNKVPLNCMNYAQDDISPQFSEAAINVIGVIQEDRVLLALTVGELAELIQGTIVSNAEKSDELVENIMLQASSMDSAPEYFSRKTNKAIIVKSDRTDIQAAALQTSTRCLVLSGKTSPAASILFQAREKGVPVILTGQDIPTAMANIDNALGKTKFNQSDKIHTLEDIMGQNFNFPVIMEMLGLNN